MIIYFKEECLEDKEEEEVEGMDMEVVDMDMEEDMVVDMVEEGIIIFELID